jgi:hypothetical protein
MGELIYWQAARIKGVGEKTHGHAQRGGQAQQGGLGDIPDEIDN